ncbi:MAG: aminopeptidase P family protein [Ruminococcus sp.]|nr:aminopeptidase P family protein [Ruminococcus sp.]
MTRLETLQAGLKNIADCAIITDEVGRRYFTGMRSSAGTVLVFPEESFLIIDFRYIEKARNTVKNCEVILEASGAEAKYAQLNDLISKHGAKTIAIDSQTLTVAELATMRNFLDAEIPADGRFGGLIRKIRMIKDREEIDKMIAAQRIAESGLEYMFSTIKEGKTERELQLALDYFMLSHGAEALSFDTIVLTGKNTSLPHGVPSDSKVKNGDFVLMDFGAVVDGYHSDMTRTVCVGQPSDKMRKVYDIVLKAQLAALDKVRAGITGKELDGIARDIITAEGYGECFGHSLGHGVGVEIHEMPYASPSSKAVLQENSIVTVEPGIYIEGEFGVRIEDFVVVKADGCENMTLAPKELMIL